MAKNIPNLMTENTKSQIQAGTKPKKTIYELQK